MESIEPSPVASPGEAPAARARPWRDAVLIAIVALTLNLAGNGRVSPWDRDEPRYATCTREMRQSGDYVHPTFNDEPRYHKPILIYWLMLAGTALGGDNPFGVRLVSSLAGVGTCLLVWGLGCRMFGPRVGRLAALMLATAPIMVAESKLATTDATLMFWLVGAQFCLWELAQRPSPRLAAVFWVLMALAVLTKGPVGPALIAIAGVVSWWWGGPTACWRRLHWGRGLLGFVALTAPWLLLVGVISRGDFFRTAVGYHVVQRMTTTLEEHAGFPGYYVLTSLLVFYPWSALMPPALLGAWSRRASHPAFPFLLGWIIGPWLFLELIQTKLIHYYLPSFAACVLVGAWLIDAVARDEVNLRRWAGGRLGLGLLGGIGIGGTVGLVALAVALPGPLRWPSLVMALALAATTLFALERFQNGQIRRATTGLIVGWAAIMLTLGGWFLPASEPYRISRLVGERLVELAEAHDAAPVLGSFQEPGVVYAVGRPVPIARNLEDFVRQVRARRLVAIALIDVERERLRDESRIAIADHGQVRGFNLNKGRMETLNMVLVRPNDPEALGASAVARRRGGSGQGSGAGAGADGEQPLVK